MHGVVQHLVGERLAPPARAGGVLGERVDGAHQAIRHVAPRASRAVREGREPSAEPRELTRHLLREQTANAHRDSLGNRNRGNQLRRRDVLLEVRVLKHQARQHLRHMVQRRGGRHPPRAFACDRSTCRSPLDAIRHSRNCIGVSGSEQRLEFSLTRHARPSDRNAYEVKFATNLAL